MHRFPAPFVRRRDRRLRQRPVKHHSHRTRGQIADCGACFARAPSTRWKVRPSPRSEPCGGDLRRLLPGHAQLLFPTPPWPPPPSARLQHRGSGHKLQRGKQPRSFSCRPNGLGMASLNQWRLPAESRPLSASRQCQLGAKLGTLCLHRIFEPPNPLMEWPWLSVQKSWVFLHVLQDNYLQRPTPTDRSWPGLGGYGANGKVWRGTDHT